MPFGDTPSHAEIIAAAAGQAAATRRLAAIAVFTASGDAGRLISKLRPALPIFAFTPSLPVARALSINYGVHPTLVPAIESTDVMIEMVERELERGNLKQGDEVAVVAGQPTGIVDGINLLKLQSSWRIIASAPFAHAIATCPCFSIMAHKLTRENEYQSWSIWAK